jgi:hypothetical protein
MREETIRVYGFAELSEQAQARAIEVLCARLAGSWWDSGDNEDVRNAMVYELATKLGTPGHDQYGEGDYPGVPGVTVAGWDMDRHQALALDGRLDRDNAPALPWTTGLDHVELSGYRSETTRVEVITGNTECTCGGEPHDDGCPGLLVRVDLAGIGTLEQAVRDVLHETWACGERTVDYKTGAAYAREISDNYAFTEDGELYA